MAQAHLHGKTLNRLTQSLLISNISFTPSGAVPVGCVNVTVLLLQPGKMDAHERPESRDAAQHGILALQRLVRDVQNIRSRIANRQLADRSAFKEKMSALQNGKDMRQERRVAIQDEIRTLEQKMQSFQRKLHDLDGEDAADDKEGTRLKSDYNDAKAKWKRTQEEWEAKLSAMVRRYPRHTLTLFLTSAFYTETDHTGLTRTPRP